MIDGSLDAIILAGGRASRLGGVAKPLLEVGGRPLLTLAVDAAADAGALRIVVAAPPLRDDPRVRWVREDPPFGGPVAGIVAALPHTDATWVLVLPADLPRARDAVARLRAAQPGPDGVRMVDAGGRAQPLTAIYRAQALRAAASALPHGGRDLPVRALVADLRVRDVQDADESALDVDTWQDLEEARRRQGVPQAAPETERTMSSENSRTLPPEALDAWAAALRERFDLTGDDLPVSLVLDLARDVANDVARPAAPFSAFAAGLVAGRAGGSPEQVREAVAAVVDLAAAWKRDGS